MIPSKHTLYCGFYLPELEMEIYLCQPENQMEYEVYYKKELLFQNIALFMPVKNEPAICMPNLIQVLDHITALPSRTALLNDRQLDWTLSPHYQLLCQYLHLYKTGNENRIRYFQEAYNYYEPALKTNLYNLLGKMRKEGNKKYRVITLLTTDQQTALLDVLAVGISLATRNRLRKAMEGHFRKSYLSELLKNLWIAEHTAGYEADKNKTAELKAIRDLLIRNY